MPRSRYELAGPIGARATVGLIVLRSDETIEHDFHRFFHAPDIATYISRVRSARFVTPRTLRAMEVDLPVAAGLLPPSVNFDVIGYGCTSAATLIGSDKIETLIKGAANTGTVTNPLNAAIAAFKSLKVNRVGFVSPYVEAVSKALRKAIAGHGIEISAYSGFNEAEEAKVARISPNSIREAALNIGAQNVDAVFLSCTNLRTLDIIEETEQTLGVPVISSNQSLLWMMAQHAGIETEHLPFGQLMRIRAS